MNAFMRNGKSMAFLDIGSGPVLLFGHGYLCDSSMWQPQLDVLSHQYRCIVPDFWAHGASDDKPDTTGSLRDYADDVLALMDHLAIEQFSVIGLSSGGVWGTELTLKAPSRVQALVLLDTFVGYEPEITKEKYLALLNQIQHNQSVSEDVIETLSKLYFANNATVDNPALLRSFRHRLESLKGASAESIAKVGHMVFDRRDAFDDIEILALPTLVMVGADDKIRSPLESQLQHDAIDGSEYVIIPNAGHMSNLEQPETVTAAIADFLKRHNV